MICLNDQLFTDAAICWAMSGLIKMIYWFGDTVLWISISFKKSYFKDGSKYLFDGGNLEKALGVIKMNAFLPS